MRVGWVAVLSICLLVLSMVAATLVAALPGKAAPSDVWTITRFDTTEPVIALTFDAGADRGYAGQILDTLAAEGIRATFGMTGVWAEQNPDLIQRIAQEGHQLINHSWNHPDFTTLSTAQRVDQLKRTEDFIRQQTGVEMAPYFRPPYGAYNDSVLNDLAANGYTINVIWTVDTLGWNGLSASQIRQRIINGATPGGNILMHVGEQSQDGPALPGIIDDLRSRGYRFATVHEFVTGNIGPAQRFFPETGHTVSNDFLRYWNRYGGLAIFGYPITDELTEDGLTVQYFERARLEWHPDLWPERFNILQGRLGAELTAGRTDELPFQPVQASTDQDCTYYPETGHRLCFGFRDYWEAHGGLAIFGFPISEEFQENGYTVQYFERQRFEYHPENDAPWDILGGHLGRMAWELRAQ